MASRPLANIKLQLVLNAVSVFTRQGAGILVFVMLARLLGPAPFGEFMYAFSMASLAAFASALGFNQLVSREAVVQPQEVQQIIGLTTSTRLTLTLGVLLVLGALAFSLGQSWWLILILAVATISDTFIEYIFCIARAKGSYRKEASFMTAMSVLHLAVLGTVVLLGASLTTVAMAFSGSKFLQLCAAVHVFRRALGPFSLRASFAEQWRHVRQSLAYATDAGLQLVTTQIDTVLIRHLVGAHAAGVYQSGMRLVTGMQNFTVIASNVLLPKLAAVHQQPGAFRQLGQRTDLFMALLGLLCAVGLFGVGSLVLTFGYGQQFAELKELLPWFSLLIGLRVYAASSGIQLTALGDQGFRTRVNACAALALLASLWFMAERFGLVGATQALFAPLLLVLVGYHWRLASLKRKASA